jgi:hypothetical protein
VKLPRVRVRVTSITTTSSLLLAGWILFSLYRRFHSSQSYARGEIFVTPGPFSVFYGIDVDQVDGAVSPFRCPDIQEIP